MDQTVLHLIDGPRQQFAERTRISKIELDKLALEVGEVQSGRDRAFSYALIGAQQIHRE